MDQVAAQQPLSPAATFQSGQQNYGMDSPYRPPSEHHSSLHRDPPDINPLQLPADQPVSRSPLSQLLNATLLTKQALLGPSKTQPLPDYHLNPTTLAVDPDVNDRGYFLLVLEEIFLVFVSLLLLHRYGNIKQLSTTVGGRCIAISVATAWFFSLNVVLLLPLDVSVSLYEQCKVEHRDDLIPCGKPWNYVSPHGIKNLWRIVYWGSFLLSWVVCPFLQSYNNSGHFTWQGRLRQALVNNALYYLSLLVLIIVLIGYLIVNHKVNILNLRSVLIAAINTWGMVFLCLLVGFGLVSLPRTWHEERDIRRTYFRFSKLNDEKSLNKSHLKELADETKRYNKRVSPQHPILRWRLDEIIRKLSIEDQNEINQSNISQHGSIGRSDIGGPDVTASDLVWLNRRLLKALSAQSRIHALWNGTLTKALLHEDIQANIKQNDQIWRPKFSNCRLLQNPMWDYYWYCGWRNRLYGVCFYFLCAASFLVVWSECTFFIQSVPISVFAAGIELFDNTFRSYLLVEMLCTFIVAYISLSAYYTLFNIKFFNIFYIAPNQLTDPNSLLFLAIMLCRLTASISLNVLSLIHMDAHIMTKVKEEVETQFTGFMGHFDVLAPVRARIYFYLPSLILLVTFATYKKFGSKIANAIGFFQFLEEDDSSDDANSPLLEDAESGLVSDNFTADIIKMGKTLVQMEMKRGARGIDATRFSPTPGSVGLKQSSRYAAQTSRMRGSGRKATYERLRTDENSASDDESGRLDQNSHMNNTLLSSHEKYGKSARKFFDDI